MIQNQFELIELGFETGGQNAIFTWAFMLDSHASDVFAGE